MKQTGSSGWGHVTLWVLAAACAVGVRAAEADREASTVILTETGQRNLGIELVEATETRFESVAFALGRLEAMPSRRAVVSSRIPGRIAEVRVVEGDRVAEGAQVARVESRQPGDPPPSVWLEAPLGGWVAESAARLGEPVEPEEAVMEIVDVSRLYAVARVPEHLAGKLAVGSKARIEVAAWPEQSFEGELKRVGTEVDHASGTLEAVFELENGEGRLRPGMRAEFAIVVNRRDGVMAVPREAVQGDGADRFVFVEDFELPHAYVRSPVVVGEANDRMVAIVSGLFPGDRVVSRGAYPLSFSGGGGGISLKEALDAAHGHEHAEDGSELTASEREERERARRAAAGGGGLPDWAETLLVGSLGANALLGVLLVLARGGRRRTREPESGAGQVG